MCCRMIETSSVLTRKSWVFFEHLRNFSKNAKKRLTGLRTTFRESSEIFGKSSKKLLLVCLCTKQNNTWLLVDKEFLFLCST